MPAALLDTNAISDLMRDHVSLKARVAAHRDPILTSVVAWGEIRYGLERLPAGKKRNDLEARAASLRGALPGEPVTLQIAESYGALKASLESQRRGLPDNDLWIAATALILGATLVSRDQGFRQVPGLAVEDWTI